MTHIRIKFRDSYKINLLLSEANFTLCSLFREKQLEAVGEDAASKMQLCLAPQELVPLWSWRQPNNLITPALYFLSNRHATAVLVYTSVRNTITLCHRQFNLVFG